MDKIENLMNEDYFDHDIIDHSVHMDEDNPNLNELSKKGYELLKLKRYPDAKTKFLELLDIDPKNPYGLVGLGDVARKEGDTTAAIDYYNKCLDYYHENKYATIGLADAYRDLGMYKKAIQIWEH